jgi:hypothetical protein
MIGIKKKNNRYQIDEGIFDIFKIIIGGKIDVKKMKDNELSKKGLALKKSAIAFEKEMLSKARKEGYKNLDDYVAAKEKELGL